MMLRNKKTGEIVEFRYLQFDHVGSLVLTIYKNAKPEMYSYNSLAELNEEWDDYEKPKEYWFIDFNGEIKEFEVLGFEWQGWMKEIGNYFETKDEAEKAVEKLKAWKRLQEAGFRFDGWTHSPITKSLTGYNLHIKAYSDKLVDYMDDLELIFGGKK